MMKTAAAQKVWAHKANERLEVAEIPFDKAVCFAMSNCLHMANLFDKAVCTDDLDSDNSDKAACGQTVDCLVLDNFDKADDLKQTSHYDSE